MTKTKKTTQIRPPIFPTSLTDPTGTDRLERGAIRSLDNRFSKAVQVYKRVLSRIPLRIAINRKYVFELDPSVLNSLLEQASIEIDSIFLEGGPQDLWFFQQYASVAAVRGAAQQFANLSQQSPVYAAGRGSAINIINSEPYRRRLTILQSRMFEEMKGIGGNSKTALSRALTDGLARGLNPKEISDNIFNSINITRSRARRVARTEITMALKRARWDESDDAYDLYALNTKEMHLSALSPTTRKTHAARHGRLYSRDQMREWFSVDANAINCKCSSVSVMVDSKGKPIVPGLRERAKATLEKMKGRNYMWSKE